MNDNILLLTDSYKTSHFKLYPPGTQAIFSYLESRGGEFDHTVFFGLQYIIKKYLCGKVVTEEKIQEAKELFAEHGVPFNEEGWRHILDKWDGRLPVEIRAVPEGAVVPVGNALMTIVNLDPQVPWLTNYLETLLLQVWYPTTVATLSWHMRELIGKYLKLTSGSTAGLEYKLHDFGCRGVSSMESAAIGGAAHLVNFKGTDTVPALSMLKKFYGAKQAAGHSISATEHSNITSWGREREGDAYLNLLEQFPTGTIACVSDSYNIYEACRDLWGDRLRSKVLEREGTLVIRPDSGEPSEVIPDILDILSTKFGFTVNDEGYKVLPSQVRVIQGDGINYDSTQEICEAMVANGYSIENIAFGMGGALLQMVNRDTQKFAIKCSAAMIDGDWVDVFKDPIDDKGKTSKKGVLRFTSDTGTYGTRVVNGHHFEEHDPGFDDLVFVNGKLLRDDSFELIRERSNQLWI